MALPLSFPADSAGVATGLRLIAERYGRPITAYCVKADNYITPADLARVVADGAVCAIKYALVRDNPDDDRFLDELVQRVDTKFIVSGIGERPAISHLTKFKLAGFTSGSVCIAPALSAALLKALKAGDGKQAAELRAEVPAARGSARRLFAATGAACGGGSLRGRRRPGRCCSFLSNLTDKSLLDRIAQASRRPAGAEPAGAAGAGSLSVQGWRVTSVRRGGGPAAEMEAHVEGRSISIAHLDRLDDLAVFLDDRGAAARPNRGG